MSRSASSDTDMIAVSPDSRWWLQVLAWGGSIIFHMGVILLSFAVLTRITPKPEAKPLKWTVSLVEPLPSAQPSEHVQTAKHSPRVHHQTVSRPQPKRRAARQRRTLLRQPSAEKTVVVSRQKIRSTQTQTRPLEQTMASQATPTLRGLPKHIAQAVARVAPTRAQVRHQEIRQSITKSATVAQALPIDKRSAPAKTSRGNEIVVNATATAHVRHPSQRQTSVVQHKASASTSLIQERQTLPKVMASTPVVQTQYTVQARQSVVARSTDQSQSVSAKPRLQHALKQPGIHTGVPDHQSLRSLKRKSKPTSIKREAEQSRRTRTSDRTLVSDGLSSEVLAFLKLLREKIEKHRQYPRVAKRLGHQGTTTVSFALSSNGDLTLLRVAEPSGHSLLDEAALNAVQSIAPLKPPTMIGNTPIEIPVAFELTR